MRPRIFRTQRTKSSEKGASPSGSGGMENTAPRSMPKTYLRKSLLKTVLTISAVSLLGLMAWIIYERYFDVDSSDDTVTYEIYGSEVSIPKSMLEAASSQEAVAEPSLDERIQNIEQDLASGYIEYERYMRLAELYESKPDIESALENYKMAKTALNPQDAYYESTLKELDESINRLESDSDD